MAANKRVLIVEDEFLIRSFLEYIIRDLGYSLGASVGTLTEAQQCASAGNFDLAIVDFHLHGKSALPVIEALAAQQTPFIVTTGNGLKSVELPAGASALLLKKPYGIEVLTEALNSVGITGSQSRKLDEPPQS